MHIQDPRLIDESYILARESPQITHLVANAASQDDWPLLSTLSSSCPRVIPFFGIHPWHLKNMTDSWLDVLAEYLDRSPSGVGEIGLDWSITHRNDRQQEEVFIAQLELAKAKSRPVCIHCVRAWERLAFILSSLAPFTSGFMLHGYNGPAHLESRLINMGAYFSFGPAILIPTRKRERSALLRVPRDRVLLETDFTFMPAHEQNRQSIDYSKEGIFKRLHEQLLTVASCSSDLLNEPGEGFLRVVYNNSLDFLSGVVDDERSRGQLA
jgi:TatD DNase family protein